jgi:hypothetical protein
MQVLIINIFLKSTCDTNHQLQGYHLQKPKLTLPMDIIFFLLALFLQLLVVLKYSNYYFLKYFLLKNILK